MARPQPRLSAPPATEEARIGAWASPGRAQLLPVSLVGAIALVILALYWPTWQSMVSVWSRSGTFAHGFLVPPIVAGLLARQRHALAALRPAPAAEGLLALALAVAAWLAGRLVQADVLSQAAMMAMLPAAVLAVFGPAVLELLAFPLFFGLLAVPAGEFLIQPLMDLTAHGSVLLLRLSGIAVYQDGWLISIPGGDFQVADACSGVRYLIGAVATGILFAWLFYRSMKKRLLFIGFVAVLTVMANVCRAYIIILLAYVTDMRLAVGVDHFIYGWFMFAVLLAVVFAVGLKFADVTPAFAPPSSADPSAFQRALGARPLRHGAMAATGIAVLAAGPLIAAIATPAWNEGVPLWLPRSVGESTLMGTLPAPAWLRPQPGWDAQHLAFRGGPVPFELHVFRGRAGSSGRDLTGLREQLDSVLVTLVSDEAVRVSRGGSEPLELRQMRLGLGNDEWMIVHWLRVGERATANPFTAKVREFGTIVAGEHQQPALVAVAVKTKGLDRPGASIQAIAADVDAALSACAIARIGADSCAAPGLNAQ